MCRRPSGKTANADNGRQTTYGGLMSWKLPNRSRLLSSAAVIGLVVTCSFDTLAIDYTKFCPQKEYVPGVYVCSNFADDFQKNCTAAGQQSWVASVTPRGTPQCDQAPAHAFNVVTAPSCDLAPDLQRYCAVEPQNGQSWCWTQSVAGAGGPSIPSWVMQSVANGIGGALANCVGQGKYASLLTQD